MIKTSLCLTIRATKQFRRNQTGSQNGSAFLVLSWKKRSLNECSVAVIRYPLIVTRLQYFSSFRCPIRRHADLAMLGSGSRRGKASILSPHRLRQQCGSISHPLWNSSCHWIHTHTQVVLLLCWNLSGTTRVSRVKPIWIYWSKRWWVTVAYAGLYASLHLIPDNHANIPPHVTGYLTRICELYSLRLLQ